MDTPHVGQCRQCAPGAYPVASIQAKRQGRYHVSHRFTMVPNAHRISVYVDGAKSLRTVEAMAGQTGWVIEYDWRPDASLGMHECPVAGISQPCEAVRYGDVRLDVEWPDDLLKVIDQIDPALIVGDVPPDIGV